MAPTEAGRFPWGTFLINITGSALLGYILILVIEQFPRGRLARPVIGTGFLGALIASVLAGLLAVWIGMTSARVVLRAERWLQQGV
jgi:fluoride ion exporter CrcB/FEX